MQWKRVDHKDGRKKDINSWNCWVKRKLLCSIQKAVGRFAKHTKRIKEQHSVQGHVKSKEKSACYVIVQMDFFRKVFKFRSRRSEESILQTDYGHPLPCRNVFSSMRMQVILLTGQLWLFWMNFYSARQLFSHLWEDSYQKWKRRCLKWNWSSIGLTQKGDRYKAPLAKWRPFVKLILDTKCFVIFFTDFLGGWYLVVLLFCILSRNILKSSLVTLNRGYSLRSTVYFIFLNNFI